MNERYGDKIDSVWAPSPRVRECLTLENSCRFRLIAATAEGTPEFTAVAGQMQSSGYPAPALQVLAALAAGDRSVDDLAVCCTDAGALAAILDRMYGEAIIEIASSQAVAAGPCYRHLRSYSLRVAGALDVPGVRRTITSNSGDRALRLGAYVEEYHYIRAAASYLARAVSSARTQRQAAILAEYFSDEYWHDAWVRQGLEAAGLSAAELACAQPLPSTLALINFLRWTADSDLPALCVCLGATEGTLASLPDIRVEFDALRSGGLLPEAAYAPFEQHARTDAENEHGSIFADVFVEEELITGADRQRIRDAVWQYWYAYRAFFHGILGYYGGQPSLGVLTFR